jgi:glutathione S-transferase
VLSLSLSLSDALMLCAKKATLATSRRPSSRFCCCGVSSSSSSKKSSRATTRGGDDDERDAMRHHHHHRLVFYRHSLCPYAHRVQLCLDELDALRKTRVVDVDLSKTPEWYLEKTRGRGMVPTMEFFFDDDPDDKEEEGFTRKSEKKELVGESLEINRRLWDQFEGTPQTTDDVERFTRKCDDTFIRAGLRAIGGGWSFTRERNEKALERLEEEIWQLDALIESHALSSRATMTNDARNNDTLFLFGGDRASLADLAIYPFAERFELALKFFQGYTLGHAEYTTKKSGKSPPSKGDHHHHPIRFQNWLETMRRLPSVRNARVKDEDALLRSWDRTMRLDYFDYETADDVHP